MFLVLSHSPTVCIQFQAHRRDETYVCFHVDVIEVTILPRHVDVHRRGIQRGFTVGRVDDGVNPMVMGFQIEAHSNFC